MLKFFEHRQRARKLAGVEEELRELAGKIEISEQIFNEVSDGDLIEAEIYERSSLLKRYAYLLREFRKSEGVCDEKLEKA